MKVLGIKCSGHDTGAALVFDDSGEMRVSAISEARLNRRKHSYTYPLLSIDYVLRNNGVKSLNDIDLICIDRHGALWPEEHSQFGRYAAQQSIKGKWDYDARFNYLIEQSIKFPKSKIAYISHIDAHAASAYYVSGFKDQSAILSIEGGIGLYAGKDNNIEIIDRTGYGDDEWQDGKLTFKSDCSRPVSRQNISNLYDVVTRKLGLDEFAAGKTMALAAFRDQFPCIDYLQIPKDRLTNGFMSDYREIIKRINEQTKSFTPTSRETKDKELLQEYWVNIAREAQDALENDVLEFARLAYEKTKSKNLCLAGGVALSCVTNRKILDLNLFENVFVQPAASDEGIPLGCALWGYHKILNGSNRFTMNNAYLGAPNNPTDLLQLLSSYQLSFKQAMATEVAEKLASGKIIGRFFGASEFGPRALGNRSIIADPRIANMLEIVNTQVKHREFYRPFAPSSHEDKQHLYFDLPCPSPFMLMACKVTPGMEKIIPAVMHVDQTSRVQTVRLDQNQEYYQLIDAFGKISGVYVLLNTSFNDDGEPIVEDYSDALMSFLRTGLDYLYAEGYLISRPPPDECAKIRAHLGEKIRERVDADYKRLIRVYCDEERMNALDVGLTKFMARDIFFRLREFQLRSEKLDLMVYPSNERSFLWARRGLNRISRHARYGTPGLTRSMAKIFMAWVYLAFLFVRKIRQG